MHELRGLNRAVACIEVGLRCGHVARGREAEDAAAQFWCHARERHGIELSGWSPADKASLHDLVDALSTSRRHPRHRRADTEPALHELVASGALRRWWC